MQIILLSGSSGTRLWPLSNNARSKQFLRLLKTEGSDELESMVQRVHRQLRASSIMDKLTVATSISQVDSVIAQLGNSVDIVAEPCRDEVWTFVDGEGMIVLDGEQRSIKRGDVINIPKGQLHTLKTITSLSSIEVQSGSNLVEEDIERFPYKW